ncbi:MAG: hypothetical protein ACR2GK_10190 [Gemmatimonadaceae bacterium]
MIAIAVGVAGIFVEHDGIRLGVALLVLALLFRLPELALAGLPIFSFSWCGPRFLKLRHQRQSPRGPGAPA